MSEAPTKDKQLDRVIVAVDSADYDVLKFCSIYMQQKIIGRAGGRLTLATTVLYES